jgi:hypothetical protein
MAVESRPQSQSRNHSVSKIEYQIYKDSRREARIGVYTNESGPMGGTHGRRINCLTALTGMPRKPV